MPHLQKDTSSRFTPEEQYINDAIELEELFSSIDLEARAYFYIVRAVNFTITVAATHVLINQVDALKSAVCEQAALLGFNIAGIDQLPSLGDSASLYFHFK
ncbi:MAG TPA: hypothetical protein VJ246_01010 [Patescibacteria group bacterium]|nr:hypothetical protein [Patescibacteria group bacterium]